MCDFGKGGLECSWGKQGLYSQNSKRSSKINGRRGTHPTVQNGCRPHYGRRSGESGEQLPLSWSSFSQYCFFSGERYVRVGWLLDPLSDSGLSLSRGSLDLSPITCSLSSARPLSRKRSVFSAELLDLPSCLFPSLS